MLAAISSLSIVAHAEDPEFTFSGLVDIYYQSDFGKPATGNSMNFRQFDTYHNGFQLATIQGTVVKKPKADNPWGFTLQLAAGKNADILASTDPAGPNSALKYVQQGFVTYAGGGYTVDLGKFLTWIGYEGIVSADNDNYSRSFLFYFAQPVYHVGARVSTTLGPATVGAYLVNGWNEAEDSNAGKSYGASGNIAIGKGSLNLAYYGGNEGAATTNGFVASGGTNVHLGDLVFVYPLSDKLKVALNADYGSAKGLDAGDPGGHFSGGAAYVKFTPDAKSAFAVRYDTFSDPDGLRSGFNARFTSLTGTYDMNFSPTSLLRAEIRYDKSNLSVFNSENGGTSKDRTTFTISHVLRF